jgi:acyl carrier protein
VNLLRKWAAIARVLAGKENFVNPQVATDGGRLQNLLDNFLPTQHDGKMTTKNSVGSVAEVREKVRAFVLEYAADHGVTEVKDDEPLLRNHIIDSLGVFRLIDFLEETFPLTVEDTDMEPEGFDNLNAISEFVVRKVQGAEVVAPPAAETHATVG